MITTVPAPRTLIIIRSRHTRLHAERLVHAYAHDAVAQHSLLFLPLRHCAPLLSFSDLHGSDSRRLHGHSAAFLPPFESNTEHQIRLNKSVLPRQGQHLFTSLSLKGLQWKSLYGTFRNDNCFTDVTERCFPLDVQVETVALVTTCVCGH